MLMSLPVQLFGLKIRGNKSPCPDVAHTAFSFLVALGKFITAYDCPSQENKQLLGETLYVNFA